MHNHPIIFNKILLPVFALLLPPVLFSQAQLVLNGANIVINQGAKLIDPAANTVTVPFVAPAGAG
jgi:hypothetical protein